MYPLQCAAGESQLAESYFDYHHLTTLAQQPYKPPTPSAPSFQPPYVFLTQTQKL